MTCTDFIEGFSDYVDGEAAPDVAEAARAHLATCPECRRYEAVYRRGVALLRSFPEVAVSDGFEPELELRLRRDTRRALGQLGRQPASSGSAMAVVFGMAVVLVTAAWAPLLLTRPAQVELPPIVAAFPTRPMQGVLPDIELLPWTPAVRSLAAFPAGRLWGEPRDLFRRYAPVLQGYAPTAVTAQLGLE
ncbi:MAG: zf-HC2 domain-containing protein [Longimicrobiales bacterium]|nr:zf-HC2 domain-containing protein [Longimicrobiales bacterium]